MSFGPVSLTQGLQLGNFSHTTRVPVTPQGGLVLGLEEFKVSQKHCIYIYISIYMYEGRPKTPVFGVNYRRTGRSKSCQKLRARKERASAAQGTRKVTVLKGFMY